MLLYQNLLNVIGAGRENTLLDLTPEDFCANMCLFALDLTGHSCNNFKVHTLYTFKKSTVVRIFFNLICLQVHLGTSGTLGINASLKESTKEVWQLVKFLQYPKCLTVDGEKNCKVEDLF